MSHETVDKGEEPTVSSRPVYSGRVIQVEEHTVQLPNGRTALREVVRHNGAVAIVAEAPGDRLVFVEQFRKAPGRRLLELPAGKLESGESPEECALRELREETGYVSEKVEPLYSFYTSPGFADEVISLFYATDLTKGDTDPDEDEFVDIRLFDHREVRLALDSGAIEDAKSLVGVLWWLSHSIADTGQGPDDTP